MTIKPIDIQANMAKMFEVGKGEQAKLGALAEQQHLLSKEAKDKSNLADARLEELEEGEKTAIRDEDKKKDQRGAHGGKGKSEDGTAPSEKMKDEKMGRIIDVFK